MFLVHHTIREPISGVGCSFTLMKMKIKRVMSWKPKIPQSCKINQWLIHPIFIGSAIGMTCGFVYSFEFFLDGLRCVSNMFSGFYDSGQ